MSWIGEDVHEPLKSDGRLSPSTNYDSRILPTKKCVVTCKTLSQWHTALVILRDLRAVPTPRTRHPRYFKCRHLLNRDNHLHRDDWTTSSPDYSRWLQTLLLPSSEYPVLAMETEEASPGLAPRRVAALP